MKLARSSAGPPPVVISLGCPSGIGPEVALKAFASRSIGALVFVGNRELLLRSAEQAGFARARIEKIHELSEGEHRFSGARIFSDFPPLRASEMQPGRPSAQGGLNQLLFVEEAFRIAKSRRWPLCTAPVSKEAIARSGSARVVKFRGHTEWLQKLDGADHSVMCFSCAQLTCSLVTTHVPLKRVPRLLSPELVVRATVELVDLLLRQGHVRPLVAVCSLNPHAGEGELLGSEETSAIVPAIARARAILGRRAQLIGPMGAETAFRKGASGSFAGVVAMYHDQATIPMKLLDFGGAVNITQGLSIARTSVDHGTAYDIAGQGIADPRGMREAIKMAARLGRVGRKIDLKGW